MVWRECIKKVWEVDRLTCPKCAGEMRIISFIYKRSVIKKILKHLNMYDEESRARAPPIPDGENIERIKIVPYNDGWPGDQESTVIVDF